MAEDRDTDHPESNKSPDSGINYENGVEEPNFDDPEDFEDDISDDELLGDLLKNKPRETDGVKSVIIVDGIPKVGPERVDKLKNVIHKFYSNFGKILTVDYPVDENSVTKGYVFIEFASPEHALEAVRLTNGHKLDKSHIFKVNSFTDYEKYENIPDEWEPPKPQPYTDHGNLKYWLQEPDACDQYSVMFDGGAKTAIYLNTNPEPTLHQERESWTETYVEWSPRGTYLATFHFRGVALWVGEKFEQFVKFQHNNVQCISFSPCEKYIVTFSNVPESREDPHCINIWEIRTGLKKRSFLAEQQPIATWPIFKWSHDDKFFAKISKDTLSIYETPSFGLLGKKSLKITGIKNFTWSPSQNVIAYWVAEEKDVPARVTLLEIPSRVELRSKNLFSVADCVMHWQKSGGYLGVKVDRYTKAKKEKNEWKYSGMYYNFEIFHMKEKNIPVDSIEIKDSIVAFAWESIGNKFAVIHGDSPNICVSFYGIKPGGTVSLLKKFERKQCNRLFWSPNGQFIVLAGLRSMSGKLEFIDTADFTVMAQNEHFMATDVEWDPTGRYVVTGISWWMHKVDNAFWLWSFQGKLLRKHDLERYCQLLWRPRPPTLLSEEKIKEIKKNLKKYSAQFDIKDRMSLSKASKEIVEKRRKLMEDFRSLRQKRLEDFSAKKKCRLELRNGVDTDELDADNENLEEEVVEFLVKEEVIVLEDD
ncbi:Eukaryotic translation initiation factor 3 subunit B [Araneus ventricosus]|uniref:Eukaryotic translation initiation factor 3 subunit B n=1 Tax=Araneus ventricosus TaxID=182803 RepID=A0A4Y2KWR6_ARAVE|nr:Eukaryotic translation initiation factor 3 subunit B [Araneus ventricosus]